MYVNLAKSAWNATDSSNGSWIKVYMTTSFIILLDQMLNYVVLVYVVVQFYPWFNFYFPLFWGMAMYDNEFKTMGNKN